MLRHPVQVDLVPDVKTLARPGVLLEDHELLTPGHPGEILGADPDEAHVGHDGDTNVLTGGRVSDVSFVGVSTQYLVRMPWDQELMVFEQNTGQRTRFGFGDEVELTWSRDHAFLLDADQDASAGIVTPDDAE